MSAVLLCICFVFFFCHAPRVVSNVIEFWNRDKIIECHNARLHLHPDKFTHALRYISDIATILNSSLNFFVYCFVGHTFRRELCRTLGFQVNIQAHYNNINIDVKQTIWQISLRNRQAKSRHIFLGKSLISIFKNFAAQMI